MGDTVTLVVHVTIGAPNVFGRNLVTLIKLRSRTKKEDLLKIVRMYDGGGRN